MGMQKKSRLIFLLGAVVLLIIGMSFSIHTFGRRSKGNNEQKMLTTKGNTQEENINKVKQDSQIEKKNTSAQDNLKNGSASEKPQKSSGEFKVKAIYVTASSAGDSKTLQHIIDLVKETELNTIVLDVKDDYGRVDYESNIDEVKQNNAYTKFYNVDNVIKTLHENNVHVIGRIVCFKDPLLASKRADLAIKRPNGQVWRENGKIPWINPYNEEAWKYNIDIAKEAADKGFDEIQFDYVRFPTARTTDVFYGNNIPSKADTISRFLETAEKEIHAGKGITFSADVFGIICESPNDYENIGQDLEKVGMNIDYVCPMVYPSHFANSKQNGDGQSINGVRFTAPDLDPYRVVYNTLAKAKERVSKVEGYKAKFRPYLQDFTATWLSSGYYQKYGADQVRQQIKAVYDAGFDEWILWDASNVYSEDALEKEKTK